MTSTLASTAVTSLLTDQYELTMVEAARGSGAADRESVFEVFARTLPGGRRYGVVAGTGRFLEQLSRFTFGDAELTWLRDRGIVGEEMLDWLADYRFSGTIHGYREGELYFPGSPILVVEGTFADAVLLETLALSVFNHDSAIAGAAARMASVAHGRPLAEMGSRRAAETSAVAAARAAYIAGFSATSNLEAGRRYGVPTMGTAAHAFTLLHDTEEDAFRAQVAALGPGTTLLVDTYDIPTAVERAVAIAGPELGAVRIDSGDLPELVAQVRNQLDDLGAPRTRITVTSDLDEYAIAGLSGSPVDGYGVGTSVVTGSGSPTAGMVYKLVARKNDDGEWVSVAKKSSAKASVGGKKYPERMLREGTAYEERITIGHPGHEESARSLLVPLVVDGEIDEQFTGPTGTAIAREHHAAAVAELPMEAFALSRGEPVLPTVYA
ncbi:nicotinate phosphoribosyltransferase [Desertivibrio insolitus]|uniref:nicotinate phosphoribosyltransferase n=1 Tax=Herbiconiux sp. SYSU D00978 TaxID=2812562 RepID=UPI001A96699A|nr:nicotinate phosphoribosyltransferase [Herbiconiux sp. SYSU D00978]